MKIVITGGPGAGKTTALELYKKEFDNIIKVIPESATTVFTSGIDRSVDPVVVKKTQKVIYELQKSLEEAFESLYNKRAIICDRGTLDGLAYWPNSEAHFFEEMNTSFEGELDKYDAVIFFETAAKKAKSIESENIYRIESNDEAIKIDEKLLNIWSRHPNFHLVKSEGSFIDKVFNGIQIIKEVLENAKL